MRTDNLSWESSFFGVAFIAAMRSKDPSTQCGACIVRNNRPLGWGYNGFVLGVKDCPEKWDSQEKLKYVVHAERNAIANSVKAGVSSFLNSEMYIWTSNPHRVHMPCADCARTIVQYEIPVVHAIMTRQVIDSGSYHDARWNTGLTLEIFETAGVRLVLHPAEEVNKRLLSVLSSKLALPEVV